MHVVIVGAMAAPLPLLVLVGWADVRALWLLPPAIASKLAQRIHRASELDAPTVTAREREIFEQIAQGRSNPAIASALHISENTVKTHIRNVYQKPGVNDRTEAVTTALRRGIIRLQRHP